MFNQQQYKYKATGLIVKQFEAKDIKFAVNTRDNIEEIRAGFPIDMGPSVIVKFFSRDNDNDVLMRVFGVVSNIPQSKRAAALRACNEINQKARFLKFRIDDDGDINVDYDFPLSLSDACVGPVAYEMFVRTMQILDKNYSIIAQALYS